MYKKSKPIRKVASNFIGKCQLNQLPYNTYFKLVKKDGSLSKKTYIKDRYSYNRYTKKYDINDVDDVCGAGREMSGKTYISTDFEY